MGKTSHCHISLTSLQYFYSPPPPTPVYLCVYTLKPLRPQDEQQYSVQVKILLTHKARGSGGGIHICSCQLTKGLQTCGVLYPAAAHSTKFCGVVASTCASGRQQSLFTRRWCYNVRVTEKGEGKTEDSVSPWDADTVKALLMKAEQSVHLWNVM